MKILITGGAGFIGSHLANYLSSKKSFNVHVCDNLITGNIKNLDSDRVVFHKIDVNNFNQISDNQRLFRSINIKINYQFGQLKFDPIKQKTNINNDDLMGGDEEGDF